VNIGCSLLNFLSVPSTGSQTAVAIDMIVGGKAEAVCSRYAIIVAALLASPRFVPLVLLQGSPCRGPQSFELSRGSQQAREELAHSAHEEGMVPFRALWEMSSVDRAEKFDQAAGGEQRAGTEKFDQAAGG